MILQIGVLLLSFLFMGQVQAQAQESAQMNMEILKEKVKADKKLLVATNMNLNDAEAEELLAAVRWIPEGTGADQSTAGQDDQRLCRSLQRRERGNLQRPGQEDHGRSVGGRGIGSDAAKIILRKIGQGFACHESRPLSPDRKQNSSPGEVRIGCVDSSRELIHPRPRLPTRGS